ncbi:MAG: AgmX/PglI C-terminal domain-containing protein [Myxococcaceae bacterium]
MRFAFVVLFLVAACASAPIRSTLSPPPASNEYRQTVREVVADHVIDAETCYYTTSEMPHPMGQVRLGFWIAGDGAVSRAELERTDFEGADFNECMVTMAMRWHFPPPPTRGAAVRVSFPYVFAGGAPE